MPTSARSLPFAALSLALCACFDPAAGRSRSSSDESGSSTSDDSSSSTATSEGTTSDDGSTSSSPSSSASTSDSSGTITGAETAGSGSESSSSASADTGSSTSGEDTSTGAEESSTGAGVDPLCGDGTLDPDEECDDGNDNDNDACSAACVEQWASGNDGDCSPALAEHCDYHGAQCRLNEEGSDSYCYWPEAAAEGDCDETPGIWTLPDSVFAMDHPEMTFPAEGACLTQAANLRCEAAIAASCTGAGADLCTPSRPPSGLGTTGPEICYWAGNEAACGATPGIWTDPSDGFAMDHPNALPAGMAACIIQVTSF